MHHALNSKYIFSQFFEQLEKGVEVKIVDPSETTSDGISDVGVTGTIIKCKSLQDKEGEQKITELMKINSKQANVGEILKNINKIDAKFENKRKFQEEISCHVKVEASVEIKGNNLQLVVTTTFSFKNDL